jgi:hypothetical protein
MTGQRRQLIGSSANYQVEWTDKKTTLFKQVKDGRCK